VKRPKKPCDHLRGRAILLDRDEPWLDGCFVDAGEDRHGFLPFKAISRIDFREGVDVRTARIQDAIREGDSLLVARAGANLPWTGGEAVAIASLSSEPLLGLSP
jgi:hypothetical protein